MGTDKFRSSVNTEYAWKACSGSDLQVVWNETHGLRNP